MSGAIRPSSAVEVRGTGHASQLVLSGELDDRSGEELLGHVRQLLSSATPPRLLVVDLSALLSCDALGLAALLMLQRLAQGAGVRLRLDHRPPSLDRLLTTTGTLAHLTAGGS